MKLLRAFAAASLVLSPLPVSASQEQDAPESASSKTCEIGPVERYFADVQWLVYACDDEETLVFVTGPASPSDLSFYFIVFKQDGAYKVYGKGNGDRALTKPAYDAISAMTQADFQSLHDEASAVQAGAA